MEINKEIVLGNKVRLNYTIIYSIKVNIKNYILITLHSFVNKEYYKKSLEKQNLQKEQLKLVEKLNNTNDETLSLKYHNEINELADKISQLNNYEDYVVGIKTIKIPFIENYNEEYLKKEIINRL